MSALDVTMTQTEAAQVTSRIKLLLSSITETTDKLIGLIEQAEAGQAWQALGYASWTAYVAAEFRESLAGLARAERIPIVEKLSSTGMSTRSIAAVTDVGKSTIDRDLHQVSHTGTPALGTDGKVYLRNGRPTAAGMVDLAGDVPPVRPKPRRRPLPDAYRDAFEDLEKALGRLERLTGDERFAGNRERLAERYVAGRWPELIGRVAVVAAALCPGVNDAGT